MSRGTVNKVILLGRLGKDPDMRYTPSGTAVANFSLATNSAIKDSEGNWTDKTEWHNIVAFGRTAEIAGEYLKKGKQVFIDGRLQTSSWEDQNGQKRYKTEIVASELQLIGPKGEGESGADTSSADVEDEAPAAEDAPPANEEEDDLPF
ncbi:MAG TPA: single-stranded DNA-binding protein [Caldithrix sp.]|nr:single-stranded DNA-binding protein [Calditrichaceae bacterium]HEM49125.1 single-stranded DNA-binding protein [Caldithrix sp.]HES59664.1 single-stranded DNA-binding protein [Caldithrix sp.]